MLSEGLVTEMTLVAISFSEILVTDHEARLERKVKLRLYLNARRLVLRWHRHETAIGG